MTEELAKFRKELAIEGHVFQGDHNRFNCELCGKPRAMHENDGTIISQTPADTERYGDQWSLKHRHGGRL